MSERPMPPSPANPERPVDCQRSFIRQVRPSQWRDLVERHSNAPCRDASAGAFQDAGRLVILDVRTLPEYFSGHLKGSINHDFRSPSFTDELAKLDRGKAYLVYCRTGIRSGRALLLMRSLGFMELYDLAGGITAWQQEGFEVVRDLEK